MQEQIADVKRKRDHNNFINLILSKIELASRFHQRIAMNITSKRILKYITLKFYIRKRYKKLFLYTRATGNFSSVTELHNLYRDFKTIIPELIIEGKQGHYTGWILPIDNSNPESLTKYLKLISLLSNTKDFYSKQTQIYRCFYNYQGSSHIPVHLNITNKIIDSLQFCDLIETLKGVLKFDIKKSNSYSNVSSDCQSNSSVNQQ